MITVSGEGKVTANPDRAIVTVGVITESKNLAQAQQENNEKATAIINALLALGIGPEKIKTVEFRVDPEYDYVEGKQVFRGYKITHLLQVTVDQIGMTGRVVDTAVRQGANYVANIQLTVSDPEGYYNQALSLALINSLEKAEILAKTMGVTVGSVPFDIQELTQAPPQPRLYQIAAAEKSAPTPIQPGEMNIVAHIKAKYDYQIEPGKQIR